MIHSLKFRDRHLEENFQISRLLSQTDSFLLVLIILSLHFLELFSVVFIKTEITQINKALPFIILITSFLIALSAGSWKFKWIAAKSNSLALLFFGLVSAELLHQFFSEIPPSSRLFFMTGINIAGLELLLILTKTPWIHTVIILGMSNSYWWLRIRPEGFFDWTLSFCCFQILTIAAYSFFSERNERKLFLNFEKIKAQLKSYENMMTGTMKNSILVIKKDHLVYSNEFATRDLPISSDQAVLETLQAIKVIRRGGINEFLKDLEEKDKGSSCKHTFSLYELYKDCEDYLLDLDVNLSTVFSTVVGEINEKGDTRTFIIQMGAAYWNTENSVLIIINDISHIKRYYNVLDSQKDNLLATVSHDLRAPLNGIMGMIELVLEELVDESCREKLNISMTSAKLMQHMINDILDFSLISKGKLRLKFETTNITKLVREIIQVLGLQAKMKGLSLEFENLIQDSDQNHIIDGNRLRQVLFNLIGNAIKYTKTGKVTVRVIEEELEIPSKKQERESHNSLRKMRPGEFSNQNRAFTSIEKIDKIERKKFHIIPPNKLVFEVEDTGIGIKEEDINKLFNLFSRVTAGHDEKMSGIGLGLAISQSLVMMMNNNQIGGKIKAYSTFGKGSRFRFPIFIEKGPSEIFKEVIDDLPIFTTKAFDQENSPKADSNQMNTLNFQTEGDFLIDTNEKKKLHVLVVDDDQLNLLVASKYLKADENSFTFKLAVNGEQAIELFCDQAQKGSPFDIILMDCNMPIMDGYEATRKLKSMMKNKEIRWTPVVALTGNSSEADKLRCEEAGMDFILSKPYKKLDLFHRIQEAMVKREYYKF